MWKETLSKITMITNYKINIYKFIYSKEINLNFIWVSPLENPQPYSKLGTSLP